MYWNQHCFFVHPGVQNVLLNEQEKLWGSKQPSFCLWTKLYLYKFFFYWNISNWQKSFGGIGREISVSRTDFLASPQFGFNPDPAANLQTNNDKKTVKNNKMSQSISSELKTVSHPWLCDHEGRKGRNRMLQEGEVSWSWAECLYRRTITRAQLCLLDPYMGLPLTRHSPLAKEMRGEMPSIIQSSKSSCSNTRCHL